MALSGRQRPQRNENGRQGIQILAADKRLTLLLSTGTRDFIRQFRKDFKKGQPLQIPPLVRLRPLAVEEHAPAPGPSLKNAATAPRRPRYLRP